MALEALASCDVFRVERGGEEKTKSDCHCRPLKPNYIVDGFYCCFHLFSSHHVCIYQFSLYMCMLDLPRFTDPDS